MIDLSNNSKKMYRYEPIERRSEDRRIEQSDRRAEIREDPDSSGRREHDDRRKK